MNTQTPVLSREDILFVKVKPNASRESLTFDKEHNYVIISLTKPPLKGKANEELLKFLKKELGVRAEILSGETSRLKKLKILSVKS